MFAPQTLLAEMAAVWRLVVHLCAVEDAEAVVQDVYMRAFDPATPPPDPSLGDARLWLFRIVCDVLHSRPAPAAASAPHTPVPILKPDDPIDSRLQRAICALPMPIRMAFLLSTVEQLRYEDVAAVLRVPVRAVLERIADAHRHLRRLPEFASLAPPLTTDVKDEP